MSWATHAHTEGAAVNTVNPTRAPEPPLPTPEAIDAAMHADKLADGYTKRSDAAAMALQIKHGDAS